MTKHNQPALKNAFGLSKDDIAALRALTRQAVEQHGAEVVAQKLSFSCIDRALSGMTMETLSRSDFGRYRNRLEDLEPKQGKRNKYVQYSKLTN